MTLKPPENGPESPENDGLDLMSERRKPMVTLLLREHEDDYRVKIEVFDAALWPNHRQFSVLSHHISSGHARFPVVKPIPESPRARTQLGALYRLRVNGVWYPEAEGKVFVTRKEIDQYLATLMEDALYV